MTDTQTINVVCGDLADREVGIWDEARRASVAAVTLENAATLFEAAHENIMAALEALQASHDNVFTYNRLAAFETLYDDPLRFNVVFRDAAADLRHYAEIKQKGGDRNGRSTAAGVSGSDEADRGAHGSGAAGAGDAAQTEAGAEQTHGQ